MEYKDIIKDIKLKNYKNIYLFYGKEFFLIDNVLKIVKENVEMIDFNLDKFNLFYWNYAFYGRKKNSYR